MLFIVSQLLALTFFLMAGSWAADRHNTKFTDSDDVGDNPAVFYHHSLKKFIPLGLESRTFGTFPHGLMAAQYSLYQFGSAQKKDCETQEYLVKKKEKCRRILLSLCDEYLIILPKLMGCIVCQYAHAFASTERHKHFEDRKAQLLALKDLIQKNNFSPRKIIKHLRAMKPFHGDYGKDFYAQCKMQLQNLVENAR